MRGRAAVLADSVRAFAEATTDSPRLLATVAQRLARAVGGCCVIALPSADGEWLEPVASHDDDAEAHALLRQAFTTPPVRMSSLTLGASVFTNGSHFFAPRLPPAEVAKRYQTPEDQERALRLDVVSLLIVALRVQGKSIGIVTIVTHGSGREPLDDDDIQLAQSLADHAALALANARLFEALNASEARLRKIVDTAHEGIWVTDADRKTTLINRRMAEMLHETPESLVGRDALEFVPQEGRAASDARLERRRAGISEQMDLRLQRRDGSILETTVSASTLTDDAGRFAGTVALITDCTERKATEEQLRQSQRMDAVGQLAGGIAHDFNNMLSVILSFGELARDELPEGHAARSDITEVLRAGERATELTRQILAFSRKQVLHPRVLDANESVAALEPMLRRIIGEDIVLARSLDPALGHIKADPGQIEQVLMNLCVNARDAMPNGGKLTIETANVDLDGAFAQAHLETQPGPHVMIAVTDTGLGMDKETQKRVFEPFFTTKEVGKGTGLGLSTVFGIVKQSGGSIWLYSEPGQGTSFKLYFPRTDEIAAAARPLEAEHSRRTGTETVLLVEDDDAVRGLVKNLLERAGYRVLLAATPVLAVESCMRNELPIDLLVTDVVMPQMNGKQLADRLLVLRPHMRVLFMSGYTDSTIVQHGMLTEGTAFLAKPITPDALLRKVRTVLDAARAL